MIVPMDEDISLKLVVITVLSFRIGTSGLLGENASLIPPQMTDGNIQTIITGISNTAVAAMMILRIKPLFSHANAAIAPYKPPADAPFAAAAMAFPVLTAPRTALAA